MCGSSQSSTKWAGGESSRLRPADPSPQADTTPCTSSRRLPRPHSRLQALIRALRSHHTRPDRPRIPAPECMEARGWSPQDVTCLRIAMANMSPSIPIALPWLSTIRQGCGTRCSIRSSPSSSQWSDSYTRDRMQHKVSCTPFASQSSPTGSGWQATMTLIFPPSHPALTTHPLASLVPATPYSREYVKVADLLGGTRSWVGQVRKFKASHELDAQWTDMPGADGAG